MTEAPPQRVAAFARLSMRRGLPASAVACAFGLLAVALGQSNSWDLRNYHLYNGWAFWTGRGDLDFAAAQVQTYFNPVLATCTYLLFTQLPPWLSTFLLGALQGLNFVPLRRIARRLLAGRPPAGYWLPTTVALVGTCGVTQLSELGGSIGDNIVSLPVLCALALILDDAAALNMRRAVAAGLLLGAAAGLKLTVAPFAVGSAVALWTVVRQQRNCGQLLGAFAAAAAAGFLLVDGFWLLRLYREFDNPLHPMFGSVFGGEFAPPFSLRDERFVPQSPVQWLFYPLVWITDPHRVSDSWFLDVRVPLAFLALPLLVARVQGADRLPARALLAGLATAYLIWLPLFGIYRYLAPLEMLAPLLTVLALERRTTATTAMLLALMLVCIRPPGWGHLQASGARFVETQIPAFPRLEDATIVLAENEPLAFLAPGFPPTTRFVRIGGNLLGPPYAPYGMDREAARRIAATEGPLYALLANPHSAQVAAVLARQHLVLGSTCAPIRSNLLTGKSSAQLCTLQRDVGRDAPTG